MTDIERAEMVRRAADYLNGVISEVTKAGLKVELTITPIESHGELVQEIILAKVSRPL